MLTVTHPQTDTDDSQQGTAWQCVGWAGQSWGRWGGTVFEVSPTSSYSIDRACLLLPRYHRERRTNHTGGPQSPQSCLASQDFANKNNNVKFRAAFQIFTEKANIPKWKHSLVCVLASVHPYKYRWATFYVRFRYVCAIHLGSTAWCTFVICMINLRLKPQHQ